MTIHADAPLWDEYDAALVAEPVDWITELCEANPGVVESSLREFVRRMGWAERIRIASEAREQGAVLREGKSATAGEYGGVLYRRPGEAL